MLNRLFWVGVVFLFSGIMMFANNRGAVESVFVPYRDLRTTPGTIVSSAVEYHGGKSSSYVYNIRYQYAAGGKWYQSSQITFSSWGGRDPAFAQSYVDRYPAGAPVTVYYLPSHPSFAVLEPAVTRDTYFYFWFTLGIGTFGTILMATWLFLILKFRN